MANLKDVRDDKQIVVTLGGKDRVVKYDMNALAELETIYGSIEEAMKVLESGKLKDVRNMLWAGICHEETKRDEDGDVIGYNIRPYDVGAMIKSPSEIPVLAEQIFTAMSKDMNIEAEEVATDESKNL